MGIGVGAAMAGRQTIVPIGTSSFMFYGWPQVAAEAPNVRYLSGGKVTAPVVYHIMAGSRRASGAQHEHTPQAMLHNVPGLVILAPGTPADVDGLFNAAFELDDPVLFVDHLLLNHTWGLVPRTPQSEIGRASLLREGSDLLIVAYSSMVVRSLEAAAVLETMGVSAGVLNLRSLAPLPVFDVLETAKEYPAVLFVDESRGPGSTAAYLAARIAEAGRLHTARSLRHGRCPRTLQRGPTRCDRSHHNDHRRSRSTPRDELAVGRPVKSPSLALVKRSSDAGVGARSTPRPTGHRP